MDNRHDLRICEFTSFFLKMETDLPKKKSNKVGPQFDLLATTTLRYAYIFDIFDVTDIGTK